MEHLKDDLENYMSQYPKVKLCRQAENLDYEPEISPSGEDHKSQGEDGSDQGQDDGGC